MSPIHFFKCLPLPKCCFFSPSRHFPRLTCKINGADCKWKPPSGVSGVWCRSSFSRRRRRRRHLHFWETSARLHFMRRDAPTSGCAALLLSAGFQTHYGDAHHADTRREIKKKKKTHRHFSSGVSRCMWKQEEGFGGRQSAGVLGWLM